jgi:hypothetical protein
MPPRLSGRATRAKIIMLTARAALKTRVEHEPAIDGFVLKLSQHGSNLAQRLTGLGAPPK